MANHEPRAQRLRRERRTRSAEREAWSKHRGAHVPTIDNPSYPTRKQVYEMAVMGGGTPEEWSARYEQRQARREQDHLKRNKRKNNKLHPHPKRPVYSPEELKRRNVLLSLPATKPDSMSWDLWKGLLKERKKLFAVANPPTRGIPDYSRKTTPARKKPTRYQEVYELGSVIATLDDPKAMKKCLDSGFDLDNIHRSSSGYRRILGVKRIPHYD